MQENFANSTNIYIFLSEKSAICHHVTGHFNLHSTCLLCEKQVVCFFPQQSDYGQFTLKWCLAFCETAVMTLLLSAPLQL